MVGDKRQQRKERMRYTQSKKIDGMGCEIEVRQKLCGAIVIWLANVMCRDMNGVCVPDFASIFEMKLYSDANDERQTLTYIRAHTQAHVDTKPKHLNITV